ncbi:MAG: LTA synthase family protein [Elusimicrobiaceae bacterium]|nr:LTA synthase family protein [Elusimicrobiaceae bacterium]
MKIKFPRVSPLCFLYLFCVISVLAYGLLKHFAFSDRLNAFFLNPGWTYTGVLLQLHAWGFILCTGASALIWNLSNKYGKLLCMGAVSFFLLLESVDAALIQLFNVRFAFEQLAQGGGVLFSAGPLIWAYLLSPAGICTIVLWISWAFICVVGYKYTLPYKKTKLLYIAALCLLCWHISPVFVKNDQQKNHLTDWIYTYFQTPAQLPGPVMDMPYSELTYQCQDGLNSRQNVIVILLESVSSHMSQYFSDGLGHLTPQLDQLARRHTAFMRHHATNYTTSQNLFSVLTGIPAICYYLITNFYKEPKFYQNTLPRLFKQEGYHTAFFTSAQQVLFKDLILQRAGFDEISDDTDPFYQGKKRFIFNSVSDDVLFARAEKWIASRSNDTPYLMFLETTTGHLPYTDPLTGKNDFEKTFLFIDAALKNFIDRLAQKDLLKNTLIVITSDHRNPSPVTHEQYGRFGSGAKVRVPLLIINGPRVPIFTGDTTHIDLPPSLAYAALSKACFHPYQQNLFSAEKTRNSCVFSQALGTEKEVFIQCGEQNAELHFLDNGAYFSHGDLSESQKEKALAFLSWLRHHNRY